MRTNHLATPAARNASRQALTPYVPPQGRELVGHKAVKAKGNVDKELDDLVAQIFDQPWFNDSSRIQGGLTPVEQTKQFVKRWINVCVTAIRDGAVAVPLRQFNNPARPEEIVDDSDDLVYLFKHPNAWDTDVDFWSQVWVYLELCGNAPILKVRDNFGVAELWPLPPQWLTPVHLPGRPLVGYLYEGPAGQRAWIPSEDIIPLKYFNPENKFWGLGTLASSVMDQNADDKITLSQALAFEEEVLNDIIFSTSDNFDDAQFERFRNMIHDRYGGIKNKGLPLLLEKTTSVNYLRRPPAEMAYMESSKLTRDRILNGFKIPPIMAGIVEDANRSNSDAQMQIFAGIVLAPRLALVQARLNRDPELFPVGSGRFCKYDNPMPEDRTFELERAKAIIDSKYGSPNDARAIQNLDPTVWGEYPIEIWQTMLAYGLKDFTREEINAAIDRRLAANILGPSGGAPGGGFGGGGGFGSGMPGQNANDPGAKANPNDPNGEPRNPGAPDGLPKPGADDDESKRILGPGAISGPVTGGRFKHTTDVAYCNERAERRLLEVRALGARVDRDLDELTSKGYKILRRFFAQQMERILENLPKVFANLPKDNEPRSFKIVGRKMILDANSCRMYPDGSKRHYTIADEAKPATLGDSFVDKRCWCGGGEVRNVLVRALDGNQIDGLDDWLRAADELANRMKGLYENAIETGADMQAKQLDLPGKFDLNNPEAEAWLRGKDREYWRDTVNATTQSQLSEALAQSMEEEPTLENLSAAVRKVFRGETEGRKKRDGGRFASSETIARTEVNGAYNGGAKMQRKALGVTKKEWIATLDERVREAHFAADGQIRGEGEAFNVGGEALDYPGDPSGSVGNIANCRCTAAALVSTDDPLDPMVGD